MRNWPVLLALAIDIFSAAAVIYWGGQDKQGRFQAHLITANLGAALFFAGPYLVFALAALIARANRKASNGILVATALLAGIGVSAHWSDHNAYLNTPTGHELTPMLGFLTTLLLWLACIVLLVVGIRCRMVIANRANREHSRPGTRIRKLS